MNISLEKKIAGGFAAALVVLGAVGLVSYRSTVQLTRDAKTVKQAQEVLTRLKSVLSSATDAQTGPRGFILTGDEFFLEPYREAAARLDADLAQLRRLMVDAGQLERIETLAVRLTEFLQHVSQNIAVRREQGFEAARARISTGEGKRLHDRVRQLVAELEGAEHRILAQREEESRVAALVTETVIMVGGVLGCSCVGAALVLILRDIRERRRAETAREKLVRELQAALSDVKTLSGLLPICGSCKRVRDDRGYWNQIEAYVSHRTAATFSHGLCPECATRQLAAAGIQASPAMQAAARQHGQTRPAPSDGSAGPQNADTAPNRIP